MSRLPPHSSSSSGSQIPYQSHPSAVSLPANVAQPSGAPHPLSSSLAHSLVSGIPAPGIFTFNSNTTAPPTPPTPSRSPLGHGQAAASQHRPPYAAFGGFGSLPRRASGSRGFVGGVGAVGDRTRVGGGNRGGAESSTPAFASGGGRAAVDQDAREWSFFGVDIPISNLRALSQDSLAPTSPTSLSASGDLGRRSSSALANQEVFSTSFGGDRWKLEILKPSSSAAPQLPAKLSLYLSCHILDTSFSPDVIPTTLMFGIRASKEQAGAREARDGWLWRVWEEEWCFGTGREYWECHTFPSFEELLENPRVAELDAFVLSIQIQSPVQAPLPHLLGSHHVPLDLLGGIQNLLDDRATGDVVIYTHERQSQASRHDEATPQVAEGDITSGDSDLLPATTYRKRTLFAHSAILKARSTYFADMLTAGWAETSGTAGAGRGRSVVRIEDFDFGTVYWLLHYLYTNEITFRPIEDVRLLPLGGDDLPEGWLSTPDRLSWDWFPISLLSLSLSHSALGDIAEGPSGPSTPTMATEPSTASTSAETVPPPSAKASGKRRANPASSVGNAAGARRRPATPDDPPSPTRVSLAAGRISPLGGGPGRVSPTNSRGGALGGEGRRGGQGLQERSSTIEGDPHVHPVGAQAPASALAIYRIAHRYSLPALASLALAQIVQTLTPRTAFPLLLSTHLWPDLHSAIKGYALAHFYEICAEPEFSRCYAEVGEGLWEHGGEVLLDFTLQLTPAWT